MGHLEFCSNCGEKNYYDYTVDGMRYHCRACGVIHYENPKPTATLICPRDREILLVKRAKEPGRGLWGLPGGFIELEETPEMAAVRELKEETQLDGTIVTLLGTCSHYNTVFGDILLIGMEVKINDWDTLKPGDDAEEAQLFNYDSRPPLAFPCHEKILDMYLVRLER